MNFAFGDRKVKKKLYQKIKMRLFSPAACISIRLVAKFLYGWLQTRYFVVFSR